MKHPAMRRAPPPERIWRTAAEDKREGPPCDIGERRWMDVIRGSIIER